MEGRGRSVEGDGRSVKLMGGLYAVIQSGCKWVLGGVGGVRWGEAGWGGWGGGYCCARGGGGGDGGRVAVLPASQGPGADDVRREADEVGECPEVGVGDAFGRVE